jgi:uncharacterized protein YndB with AHSA1/START domain
MPAIIKDLIIVAPPKRVWAALTQPDEIGHWWTNDLNITPEEGSIAEFRFGEWGDFVLRFEVAELDQNKKIHWIHRLSPAAQWAGTDITWQLTATHYGTTLVFTHAGFAQADEIYEQARGNWAYFLDSLKSYLETGKGTPGVSPIMKANTYLLSGDPQF